MARMRIVFVHNNFPGQFAHLAATLATRGHEVMAIGSNTARTLPGVSLASYKLGTGSTPGIAPPAVKFETDVLRGIGAMRAGAELKKRGWNADLIVGHNGWGETLFLKEIWPEARLLLYAELFLAPRGLDVGFDPEFLNADPMHLASVIAKNASTTLALTMADAAYTPTGFQRDSFPSSLKSRIRISHEGIETENARPRPDAKVTLTDPAITLSANDEVITHVNRNLEPMRGIHSFLRALPAILRARPRAQVLIVGDDSARPYGAAPPAGKRWRDVFMDEYDNTVDRSRIHFMGRIDRNRYLDVLAISSAHVYLTYPFVLSWSLLEAMSAGCLVVASDTPPVREVITHEKTGLMADFFDHNAIARTVIAALAKPADYTEMRLAAREHVIRNFDLRTHCLPNLIALVEALSP